MSWSCTTCRLQDKYDRIRENETAYESYRLDDADVILVAYGISSRIARSAVDAARKEGIKAGLFRPISLWPFPEKELRTYAERGAKFISVEMSEGQMREDIRLASGCRHGRAGLPLWRKFDCAGLCFREDQGGGLDGG